MRLNIAALSSVLLHVYEPRYRFNDASSIGKQNLAASECVNTMNKTEYVLNYCGQFQFNDPKNLLILVHLRIMVHCYSFVVLLYTPDGRSIVRYHWSTNVFHVIDRSTRDGYNTARVQLIQDHPVEQEQFDGFVFRDKDFLRMRIFSIRIISIKSKYLQSCA